MGFSAEFPKLPPLGTSFAGLASLRDVLISSASGSPGDAREPSLGVLAGLIEEQESAGVVRQALDSRSTGSGLAAVQAFVKKAAPILRGHPWGPYVEALSIDSATEADRLNKTLDKVHERDFGGWVNEAIRELNITDAERQILSARWQTPAYLAMDNVADDFNDDNAAAKAGSADLENYLWRLRQTSPHYALLMASWLRSMPAARIVADKSLYEQAMTQVESEFSDRSTVVAAAVDWADRRADFTRSLKLLRNLDQTNPSSQVCQQIARLCRRLGYRQSAEQYLLRGLAVNSDVSQTLGLNQQRSEYLIDDGKYSDALSCLTASGDTPDARSLQLMARCYEHLGRINEAADCMTQLCVVDPLSIEQYYMWAQRVGRKDVNEIGRKAAAAFAATGDDVDRTAFMRLAQNQDRMALDIMRQHLGNSSNAKEFAQALVLAVKLNDASETSELLKRMPNDGGDDQPGFGIAINALANSDNIDAGVRAFEAWVSRQLDLENAVDWYSLAGRYLVAAGHAAQGRRYLDKALAEAPRERESYFLAWRELKRIAK
jgi:tetratricopeptide (TPR) repeat protein